MKALFPSSSLNFRKKTWIYFTLSLVYIFFFTLSSSLEPGDITNGRNFFKQESRSDFFGTYAGFLYSTIPEWPLGWARNLTLIQIVIALMGLFFLVPIRNTSHHFTYWIILAVHYFVAVFSSQQSRDGALFSQFIFGLGIINYAVTINRYRKILFSFGILVLVSGLAFRPIMSISGVIVFLFLISILNQFKKIIKGTTTVVISILIIFLPTSLELSLTHLLVRQSSFPLQTVMLQDLGFAACQSANPLTIDKSIRALSPLSTDVQFKDRICQFYRIYTWQSLLGIIAPSQTTKDLSAPIRSVNTSKEFVSLSKDWFSILIFSDPKTYVQAKLTFLPQVLFSSQTKIWGPKRDLSNKNIIETISDLNKNVAYALYLPWIVLSSLYLTSPFAILSMSLLANSILRQKASLERLGLVPIMIFSSIVTNTIFFISDNARYTSAFLIFSFICYALVLNSRGQNRV